MCPARAPARRDGDEPTLARVRVMDLLEGKWRLESRLGEGGMGVVYLARDLQLDRPVAVKLLGLAYTGDEEVVARFEREAKVTASLEHPNVVPVYSVGRYEGRPFLVMKKLEGQTLAALLRVKARLSTEETLQLFRQICAGVGFIHARGFVHRDLKTANLFVGPDGHATILDFGILRPQQGGAALTRTGMVMGTPQYMSPEQALGVRDVDPRADLYALGVILYECLTGALPFDAATDLELIQQQAHTPPPDARARAPWVSPALGQLLQRALAKRPDDRYPTAAALLEAFETALSAPSAEAPASSSKGTMVSKRRLQAPAVAPRPRRGLLAAGLILLLALVAGGLAWLRWPAPAPPATPRPSLAEEAASAPPSSEEAPAFSLAPGEEESPTPSEAIDSPPEDSAESPPTRRTRSDARAARGGRQGRGQVTVITLYGGEPYWAEVIIDGASHGRTPKVVELSAGSHKVRVVRAGFRPREKEIKIAPGQASVVRIALSP